MPWVRLDDQLWANRKVVVAGNEVTGAYCRMLSYCGAQLTDGHVPDDVVGFIAKPAVRRKLVDHSFVEQNGSGLLIPDYLEFNPTKEKAEEERAEARERMRKLRAKRRENEQ